MGVALKKARLDSFVVLKRAGDVGGTWRDNHYPGRPATSPRSCTRSRSSPIRPGPAVFRRNPSLKAYLGHCASIKYGLGPHLRFGAAVIEARYDEATAFVAGAPWPAPRS